MINNALVDVSVVIVNYNAGPLLERCIDICVEQVAEIVVVDNASSDGSFEVIRRKYGKHPSVQTVANSSNLGFAVACNMGAEKTSKNRVLFLNPDCALESGAVKVLLDVLDGDTDAGMAGGLLLDRDGTEQAGGRRSVPTPWRTFIRIFHLSSLGNRWPKLFSDFDLHKQPLPKQPISVEAISGACTMVKREAMEDVGPWDDKYFLHCEDLDLCMRYRQNGWSILFVPGARIFHERGACSRSRPVFVEWNKHHGMMRFYRKFFRHQYPGLLFLLVGLGVWLRFTAVLISIGLKSVKNLTSKAR
jgi:GT2 family glycosyltransferase